MAQPNNRILRRMLDRLFAAIVNGPALNCRPHASRQRLDLSQFEKLADVPVDEVLRALLSDHHRVTLRPRVAPPVAKAQATDRGRNKRGGRKAEAESAEEAALPAETERHSAPDSIPTAQSSVPDGLHSPDSATHASPAASLPDAVLSTVEAETLSAAERAWRDQQAVLSRLNTIAQDAKTYEQDTGVHVLNVGFPLLSLPPGTFGLGDGVSTRRILAPIAFIPISLTLKRGAAPSIELAAKGSGIDLVTPNIALLAWLEQQTGKAPGELFADDEGADPWREISEAVRVVAKAFSCEVPALFHEPKAAPPAVHPSGGATSVTPSHAETTLDRQTSDELPSTEDPRPSVPNEKSALPIPPDLHLISVPKTDDMDPRPSILTSAIVGLFPVANQGLLRDMQKMVEGEDLAGPVLSFIDVKVSLDRPPTPLPSGPSDGEIDDGAPATNASATPASASAQTTERDALDSRFVSAADPCQASAVRLARHAAGLVVHGPPGTGKSQTITNIIGDHLSRGQRVLMVCDKRTALDVVAHRLRHIGLGELCAVIHDPQRDQRELYRTIRLQIESLPETRPDAKIAGKLARADAEQRDLHDELTNYHRALIDREPGTGLSLHEMVGEWLRLSDLTQLDEPAAIADAPALALVEQHARDVGELLQRSLDCDYPHNPWVSAAGPSLGAFLAMPMNTVRAATSAMAQVAAEADETRDARIPAFAPTIDLSAQAAARTSLAARMEPIAQSADLTVAARWANGSREAWAAARQQIAAVDALTQIVRTAPLDAELSLAQSGQVTDAAHLSENLAALAAYLDVSRKWYAFAALKPKSLASKVLNPLGLTLSPENAQRAHRYLVGQRARLATQQLVSSLEGSANSPGAPSASADASLLTRLDAHVAVLDLLLTSQADASLAPLQSLIRSALTDRAFAGNLLEGLNLAPARAKALENFEATIPRSGLLSPAFVARAVAEGRAGAALTPIISPLNERVDSLENVLRVREGTAALPVALREPVASLIAGSVDSETGLRTLRRASLAAAISSRLAGNPHLQNIDAERLKNSFDRYRVLQNEKRKLVRDSILELWQGRQRERLLASTGSRLSPMGAELKRRLTLRGERAMRLRQAIALGRSTEGGDPLLDLCPIWMCSPETVAQVFPREAIFDVVVFDEASQCRLEEALPVLLRGQRVVIAGDPRQLPPTRFFESAVAASEDEELQTDQQLFESQQGEVEDLLEAALGLDIRQSYLDVHYRSQNADLIAFSNSHFYASRLQPIPAHPSRIALTPPVTLHRADGIYARRQNDAEADKVVELVDELLALPEVPSIGIACFNVPQRDLIVEKLEEKAAEDPQFAKRYAAAQTRVGSGSFEGLFVKNLENVQGDERDQIIISTTYGPDAKGKFYRRFGPLGLAGGGRRLNVLITRARHAVHLVTSIPAEQYRTLPTLESGQTPGGGYLLFAYLQFANRLAGLYEARSLPPSLAPSPPGNGPTEPLVSNAQVTVHPIRTPSPLAASLANKLFARDQLPSDVNWGNEGFRIDIALRAAGAPPASALGVLCDGSRFAAADDPIEWDVFRTGVLESQGWPLHRIWSPHFFRDPVGVMKGVVQKLPKA